MAAALLLAGCGGSSSPAGGQTADPGPGTGTITFTGTDNAETYQPVIKAFEAKNPGIKVAYTQIPFDQFNATMQQRLSAKDTGIDVYTVDEPRVSQLAAKGFLTDLSDLDGQVKTKVSAAAYKTNH